MGSRSPHGSLSPLTGRAAAQAALPRDSVSMPRMFQPMAVDEEGIAINTMQMIQNDIISQRMRTEKKVVVFMCGLPARGKSFISKKLTRYLRWMGYNTQVFNVGNLRRQRKETNEHTAQFFDPNNTQAKSTREQLAMDVLEEAIKWLREGGGQVAIHDATNSTEARRRAVYVRAKQEPDVQVIFIESICDDPQVLEQNLTLKLKSPDYINVDSVTARRDFLERLRNYEKAYETLSDTEGDYSFIKVIDVGKKIVAKNISSYLPGQICTFLMNMHLEKRPIWLTRHGQSVYNVESRIGGDSELSPLGRQYARAFSAFIQESQRETAGPKTSGPALLTVEGAKDRFMRTKGRGPIASPVAPRIDLMVENASAPPRGVIFGRDELAGLSMLEQQRVRRDSLATNIPPLIAEFTPAGSPRTKHDEEEKVTVWTSTLKRAVMTSAYLPTNCNFHQTTMLNEIYAGRCEGMTYGQVMNELPLEFLARARDKLRYRYPGSGESYIDVVERVRPLITEIERVKCPVIIVGHMASLRAVYSYFMDIPLEDVPYLSFPLHTAVCLTEMPYGMEEKVYQWVEQDSEGGYVWEYLEGYSVKSDLTRSDASELMTSVTALGQEYSAISDAEFRQLRETAKRMRIEEQEEKEREHQLRMQFQYARSTKRQCEWAGCGRVFDNHPLFVAHVISEHCSRGPAQALEAGPAEAEALAIDQTNGR